VPGLVGLTTIDATNPLKGPAANFDSLAQEVNPSLAGCLVNEIALDPSVYILPTLWRRSDVRTKQQGPDHLPRARSGTAC
jgi:hypothetical protein